MKVFRIIELALGIILLTPAVYSVFMLVPVLQDIKEESLWTGFRATAGGGMGFSNDMVAIAGYTSALPFYFGLMAIAGAYLIKDSKK